MSIFLLNFKKQFAPAVESGEKRQTVRRNRKDSKRPVVGDTVKCYTGLRTRGARLLRTETVTECLSVRMYLDNGTVVVDGRVLDYFEREAFAKADGFATVHDMLQWFRDQYETYDFEGFCVRWSPAAATNSHG